SSQPMPQAVAVDAMGGDFAPEAVVQGSLLAARDHGIRIVLVGPEDRLAPLLQGADADTRGRARIHHAPDTIGMADHPVDAIRRGRQSSLVQSIQLVKQDPDVGSAMSAGNSGAFMAGGKLILGGIPGIFRPGFTIQLPSPRGPVVLLDAGAAVDCSAESLVQFGVMGHHYARLILDRPEPKVALLNVGEEEGKGSQAVKEAYEYFRQAPVNFVGNIEGDRVFEGDADVIVCDGFAGNILLKTAEGVVQRLMHELKGALTATPVRKLGAFLARDAFRQIKQGYDWEEMAGGVLLGVRGNLVVTHGKSGARGIMNSIRLAHRTAEFGLARTIAGALQETPGAQAAGAAAPE
ncbi:MAG TPA: phosphate acyltransferase PlsX, partial [bacterium]|nr:phosphate acyltransferase PlsX [bacterium]